jgi:hypothetical protein
LGDRRKHAVPGEFDDARTRPITDARQAVLHCAFLLRVLISVLISTQEQPDEATVKSLESLMLVNVLKHVPAY